MQIKTEKSDDKQKICLLQVCNMESVGANESIQCIKLLGKSFLFPMIWYIFSLVLYNYIYQLASS